MTAQADDARSPTAARASALDFMVFDLGGVIFTRSQALPELAARLGAPADITPGAFRAAYAAGRNDYDRDSDAAAYWTSVARLCGAPEPTDRDIRALTSLDFEGWSHADPDVIAIVDELHRTGVRLAVLSNAPKEMVCNVRSQSWGRLFEHVVMSGALGLLKPEPAIYEYLLDELRAPADRVAFTDDLVANVAGAAGMGIHGIHFTSAAALRGELARLGVPL